MTISVIVPTYHRPSHLALCLGSLRAQARPADEVLVVVRSEDLSTRSFLEKFATGNLSLRIITADLCGQVAALNAGLEAARGDVLVFTDDDAICAPDWLKRIEERFCSDAKIGGLGGRECRVNNLGLTVDKRLPVGRICWFGKITGNFGFDTTMIREIDHLKGVNMSFRREAIGGIRFDRRLRGNGAQPRNDMAFSLAIKRKGWKNVYDPAIVVTHHLAERYDEDFRTGFNRVAAENFAYNETTVLLSYLPTLKRLAAVLWQVLVGNNSLAPGLAKWLCLSFLKEKECWARLRAAFYGRWQGFRDLICIHYK